MGAVPEALDDGSILVVIWVLSKIVECSKLLRCGGKWIVYDAAPKGPLIEGLQIKASNDTEVVGAPTKCNPQVRVYVLVSIGYSTIGENDLVICNVVADETFTRRKE